MSAYQKTITAILAAKGVIGVDVAEVEAWMRCELGTLDHLSTAEFTREVMLAVATIAECTLEETTMGLRALPKEALRP